jgi:phosphatidylethanolamine-binding protein (PEBP) family uncharacterized protein
VASHRVHHGMRLTIGTYDGGADVCTMRIRRDRGVRVRGVRMVALVSLSVALSIVCAGCGSGVGASTARARPKAIAFTSPALVPSGRPGRGPSIPVRYTCDGTNTTPSFRWGPVPPNTAELTLFLFKVGRSTPAGNGNTRVEVSVEWAIAGLSPRIHAIPAGKIPSGAVVAGKRYSICPAKGNPGTYIFQLNALSTRLGVRPHFDARALFQAAEGTTVASGTIASSYKRV